MNIGEKIKQLRNDKNLTQPQLAEAIGIEQSYLSKLENDKSIPSADIFSAILKALAINVADFLEGIDEKIIYRQLRQIPEVANHLNAGVAYKIHNIKKWLFGSAAACVIGLTLIVAGYESLIFSRNTYEYSSGGLLKKGEPDDVFERPEIYKSDNGCMKTLGSQGFTETQECKALSIDIQSRSRLETILSPDYKGRVIYINQENGQRAFIYRGPQFGNNRSNNLLMLLGSLLTFSGIFGFFVEYRLRKILP